MNIIQTGSIAFFLIICSHYLNAQEKISDELILNLIKESPVSNSLWSVSVRDTAGNLLVSYNSDQLVTPASNLKMVTSAAILNHLGPDFRFTTNIYGDGYLHDNTWIGDMHVRGSGDPSISGKMYNNQKWYVFDRLYDSLLIRGIHSINGDLYGNQSLFEDEPYPPGWEWDDLSFYYAPEISALSFNDNCVDLTVTASESIGSAPAISWFPLDTDYVTFINNQVITPVNVPYNEYYRRVLATNTIILASTLPRGYIELESLTITDPPLFFLDTFRKYTSTQGMNWNGRIFNDKSYRNWDSWQLLATHVSETISELLKVMNKDSDNFYSEMLMRTTSAHVFDTQASNDLGLSVVRDFALQNGFTTGNFHLKDASGLAAYTLITTGEMSDFLIRMRSHQYFDTYINSMSVAGIDGNFRNRFGRSPLIGMIYGKSGFISGVRAISGYMTTSSNNTVAFSIVTNNYTVRTPIVDAVQQGILEVVYNHY